MLKKLDLSLTAYTMCKVLLVLFAVFGAVGSAVSLFVFPFEAPLPWLLGLVLGFGLSLSKVVLLERMLERSVDMEGKQAKNYGSWQAIQRYLLTLAVLLLVVFLPEWFGLWGVIAGLLSLQLSAFITGRLLKDKNLDADEG